MKRKNKTYFITNNLTTLGLILIGVGMIISGITYVTYIKISSNVIEKNAGVKKNDIVIECTKTKLSPSSTVNCSIKGKNFTNKVSSISAKISVGNNLTMKNITFDNTQWKGSIEKDSIDLYTAENKTGNFTIATFTLNTSNVSSGYNSTINLKKINISNEKFDTTTYTDEFLSIRIMSNINLLKDLKVSNTALQFKDTTKTYSLTTEQESVAISATKKTTTSTVSGLGTKKLKHGLNTFKIKVTSESGVSTYYTINITRKLKVTYNNKIKVDETKKTVKLENKMTNKALNKKEFVDMIETTGKVEITDNKGKVISNDDPIATGYDVSINAEGVNYKYKTIIIGDVNGDGKITVTDVSRSYQYYKNSIKMDDIYVSAADVKNDEKVDMEDVNGLFQQIRVENK